MSDFRDLGREEPVGPGHLPLCRWNEPMPGGETWRDMPGTHSEDKKMIYALYRRGLYRLRSIEERRRRVGATLGKKRCSYCGGLGHNRRGCRKREAA